MRVGPTSRDGEQRSLHSVTQHNGSTVARYLYQILGGVRMGALEESGHHLINHLLGGVDQTAEARDARRPFTRAWRPIRSRPCLS